MNRFVTLLQPSQRRGAFMPFFMLGDPTPARSLELIRAALDEGADALELGIPFSDPIADGKVIQASAQRAARAGADVRVCLDLVAEIRRFSDAPLGLLVYYNLIHRRGVEAFCQDAAAAGADALLAADVPFDRAGELPAAMEANGLGSVYLCSQNTPDDRAARILQASTAFTYAVGVMGTTGAREDLAPATREFVLRLRRLSPRPFVVGFGVSRPEHAVEILRLGADGVIVGSALIRMIERHGEDHAAAMRDIRAFVGAVKSARTACQD
ncbi:MAG: tryptophan synthase subunit alpha [Phycisphaerales bacterium]|nr:tryptophan synthase subunit alpha [Phycisphaerales bacterium]